MVIIVIIVYALLVVFEFIPQYKKKGGRDFWVNAVLGVLSFTIALLLSLDVKIPSPEKPFREIITMLVGK